MFGGLGAAIVLSHVGPVLVPGTDPRTIFEITFYAALVFSLAAALGNIIQWEES